MNFPRPDLSDKDDITAAIVRARRFMDYLPYDRDQQMIETYIAELEMQLGLMERRQEKR